MATARVETVPPVVPEVRYILELNGTEADVLLIILGRFSAGGLTSDVFNALANARGPLRDDNYRVTGQYEENLPGTLRVRRGSNV